MLSDTQGFVHADEAEKLNMVDGKLDATLQSHYSDEIMESSALSENSSVYFLESNGDKKLFEPEVKGGNCGFEPTETQVVQNGSKEMSSLVGRVGLTVSETGNACLEHEGLVIMGRKQSEDCSGNLELKIVGNHGKYFNGNVEGKVLEMNVNQCLNRKNETGSKRSYSRNEMESLRFLNVEEQQRNWNEIYLNLEPAIAREYEGVADTQKQARGKRKKKGPIRNMSKHNENVPIFGEVSYQTMEQNLEEKIGGENCSQGLGNFREKSPLHFACASHQNDETADCNIVDNACEEGIESGSDDEFDNIQKPAFLVEGDPDFDSGSPQDGLEYLRRVRWEAAQIPKVKVVKIDGFNLKSEQTVYMPMIPDIAKCPDHLLPSKDWEDTFLADFSELRGAIAQHDTLSLQNSNTLQKHFNANEDSCSLFSGDPMMSTVLEMDAVSRASMLRSRIKTLEEMSTLSRKDCAWLYALCAVVDTPFNADTGASLRCLLRKCAKLRSEKQEYDDELVMLNILVTISGRYFGQAES